MKNPQLTHTLAHTHTNLRIVWHSISQAFLQSTILTKIMHMSRYVLQVHGTRMLINTVIDEVNLHDEPLTHESKENFRTLLIENLLWISNQPENCSFNFTLPFPKVRNECKFVCSLQKLHSNQEHAPISFALSPETSLGTSTFQHRLRSNSEWTSLAVPGLYRYLPLNSKKSCQVKILLIQAKFD